MTEPQMLGKYRLVRRLAQGGMAEIFLAKHSGPGGFEKSVVIKRILPAFAQQQEFVRMFIDEARIAAQLSHPGIVQLFDFGDTPEPFLCMEYLVGEDLGFILKQCVAQELPIPFNITAHVLASAADALHYAHTFEDDFGKPANIVHRDVTPSNIFLTFQGVVKVLDFGIARAENRLDQTRAGLIKGKLKYMSPEQILAKPIDARSDLFALGVVGYVMLTLSEPFARPTQAEVFQALVKEPIKPPREINPDVPPELEAVVMKALSRDVKQRFQTAEELKNALSDYLATATYVPHASQISGFLKELLGEAHIKKRSSMHREQISDVSDRTQMEPSNKSNRQTLSEAAEDGDAPVSDETGTDSRSEPSQKSTRREKVVDGEDSMGALSVSSVISDVTKPRRSPSKRSVPKLPTTASAPGAPRRKKKSTPSPVVAALIGIIIAAFGAAGLLRLLRSEPVVLEPGLAFDAGVRAAPTQVDSGAPAEVVVDAGRPVETPRRIDAGRAVAATVVDAGQKATSGGDAGSPERDAGQKSSPRPQYGTINVNCVPWCKIIIDGKDNDLTSPLTDYRLKAGNHRLKLINGISGGVVEKKIDVDPNESVPVIVKF